MPLTIHSNGSVFIDDDTFDQADLLWSMKQSDQAPSTACPSPQAYLDAYQCGEEDIYVVTLSALLSGSHNSAEQARVLMEEDNPEINVHVFNSCSASSGEVLVALKIKELAETGMPFRKVVREVEQFIYQMQTLFVLESLENLRKNGRLTRLQAVVTGALKIKLLMAATPEGRYASWVRPSPPDRLWSRWWIKWPAIRGTRQDIGHHHCNCLERAFQVKDMVEAKCKFAQTIILEAGGITSVYANDAVL